MYSKTAIQAVKKGVAQGEKVVKSSCRWRPRNGCDGWCMAKNLITTMQVNLCPS